jgi:NAD(P)H-hydrate epimerase
MRVFDPKELSKLFVPHSQSNGEDNGQVIIIGGSKLFHGAPLFGLKVASRIVDMVFFSSPEPSVGQVAEKIKSNLLSFIWAPWNEVDHYIEKADAVLIGPGFMRFESEKDAKHVELKELDGEGKRTREITRDLLTKFPNKKWVIDAGSLQTMDVDWIPENAIVTPNKKEFEILFKAKSENEQTVQEVAAKFKCNIILKGPETIVCSPSDGVIVKGGNAGMTKGGTGDVHAGLAVSLLAKNDPFLAATASSYIIKRAADNLYKKVGTYYNSDDLAIEIPKTLNESR